VESTTPRVIDDTATVSHRITSSLIRRTATIGMGVALIAGIATPSFAATGKAAHSSAPAAVVAAAPAAPATQATHAAPATHAAVAPAAAPAAPSDKALLPHGKAHHQVAIKTSAKQRANAKAIVKASKEMNLPPRAAVIAVATSLQESKLNNYGDLGNRNDHDSLGLFQQRPSCGWGSPKQITNPDHAAKAFLSRLVKVHNWKNLPLTVAAQKVQVSAFGDRYAQWENQAANLVKATYNN
jgi:hypothetical protein